jgi:hypothetical protein
MAETVLPLDGRLESSSVPSFQNQLSQATLLGNERLVLDLSGVSFVGSAASYPGDGEDLACPVGGWRCAQRCGESGSWAGHMGSPSLSMTSRGCAASHSASN